MNTSEYSLVQDPNLELGFAVGHLADYRAELKIAIDRALEHHTEIPGTEIIVCRPHSLIDSLAYAAVRVQQIINEGVGSERDSFVWQVTLATIGSLIVDSFKADLVIFLPIEPENPFEAAIELGIKEVLSQYNIPHEIVNEETFEQTLEVIATLVEDNKAKEENDNGYPIEDDLNGEDQ